MDLHKVRAGVHPSRQWDLCSVDTVSVEVSVEVSTPSSGKAREKEATEAEAALCVKVGHRERKATGNQLCVPSGL